MERCGQAGRVVGLAAPVERERLERRCRLVAVENHLQLGGTIILAGHAEFAWAGFASVLPLAGGRLIPIEGDIYRELGGGLIGAGDHIILQSDSPKQVLERHRVFSQTTRDFVTTEWGVDHDWQEIGTYCLLRHWSFFPALRLAKEAIGRPILTTNRENTWTFDAVLDEDIDKLRALSQAGGVPVQGTTDTGLETQDSVVESQLESAYDTALGSVGAL